MDKKNKLIIAISLVAVIIVLIFTLLTYLNNNLTNIKVTSKLEFTVGVNSSGKVKTLENKNEYAESIKLEDIKNKNINDAIKFLLDTGIKEENLNEKAISYNVYINIDSDNEKTIDKYEEMIKNDKEKYLPENEAGIELYFENE